MKKRLLEYIACPSCHGDLVLGDGCVWMAEEIVSGVLLCHCGKSFSVRDGVPVLLLGGLSRLESKTARSFGYEWTLFSALFPIYRTNFLNYIDPIQESFFKDKVVLDAGSGNGRHAYWAAHFGARDVIAMDVGEAAFVTQKNCANTPNIHVVQGDILHPPFKRDVFDYVFSIGVLHHLPDPEAGFRSLVPLVRLRGALSIWVYGRANNISNVYIYETLRVLTRHIPHPLLYVFAYVPALGVQCMNWLYLACARTPFLRRIARHIPFSYYADFPFYVKVNDAFDVFSAPRSTYWRKSEIEAWYAAAGFTDYAVSYLRKKGVKAFGLRP